MARKISFLFCAFLRFRSRLISSIVSNLTVGIIKLSLIHYCIDRSIGIIISTFLEKLICLISWAVLVIENICRTERCVFH